MRMPEDYALVYGLYGVILFELKRYEESQVSSAELMYIQQLTGEQVEIPGFDEMKAIFEMHEIQMGVNEKVLGLAYALGRHFKEAGEKDLARFHFGVVYDLTKSEEVKGEIAKLGN